MWMSTGEAKGAQGGHAPPPPAFFPPRSTGGGGHGPLVGSRDLVYATTQPTP